MSDSTLDLKKRKNKPRTAKNSNNNLVETIIEKFQEVVSECPTEVEHSNKDPDACQMNSTRNHRKKYVDEKGGRDSREIMKMEKIGSSGSCSRNQRKKKVQNKGQRTQIEQTTELCVAEDPHPPSVQDSGNEAVDKTTSEDCLTIQGNHHTPTEIKSQSAQPIVPVFKKRKTQASQRQSGRMKSKDEEMERQRSEAGPALPMDIDLPCIVQITPCLDEKTGEHLQTVSTQPSLLEVVKDIGLSRSTEALTTLPDNLKPVKPLKVVVEESMKKYNKVAEVMAEMFQKSETQEKNDHYGLETINEVSITNEIESTNPSELGTVCDQEPKFPVTLNSQLSKTVNSEQDEKVSASANISDINKNQNKSIIIKEIEIPCKDKFQILENEKPSSEKENSITEISKEALYVHENKQNGNEDFVINAKETTCKLSMESNKSFESKYEKQKDDNLDHLVHRSDKSLGDVSVIQNTTGDQKAQQCAGEDDEALNQPTQEIIFHECVEDKLEDDCGDTTCKMDLSEFDPISNENLNDKEKKAKNEMLMDAVHVNIEDQRKAADIRDSDRSVPTNDVNLEVVEMDDCQAKNDNTVDDLSDSQLCAMDEDFMEEIDCQNHNSRYNQKTPLKPPPLDGTNIVQGIIRELSQLNSFVLKKKREMDAAKRKNMKSKWNLQSSSASDQPQWSSRT